MVLSELMLTSDKYKDSDQSKYLFKGNSCYPISPLGGEEKIVSPNDQIFKIFERFPDFYNKTDLSFVNSDEHISYVENTLKQTKHRSDLNSKLSLSSPDLVDLLKQMLEINPFFRSSAKKLLKHKVFDDIRH